MHSRCAMSLDRGIDPHCPIDDDEDMSHTSYSSYTESLSDRELARELSYCEALPGISPMRRALVDESARRASKSEPDSTPGVIDLQLTK